jgi:quinol monooxygenase YgiN
MVSFTVRMRFDPKDHDKVAEMVRALIAPTHQEPGCVTYIPHFVADDPTTVLFYEQYKDEAALDAHRNSPHFKQYAAGGLFQIMLDRKLENLNAIS